MDRCIWCGEYVPEDAPSGEYEPEFCSEQCWMEAELAYLEQLDWLKSCASLGNDIPQNLEPGT